MNKTKTRRLGALVLCSAVFLCGCALGGGETEDPDVVGWRHFDEGSGQTVTDSSGGGWDLTLGADVSVETVDPAWTTEGSSGGGLAFTSAEGDYVKGALPAPSFLATQEITVEFWIKTSSSSYSHPVLAGNGVFQAQLSGAGLLSAIVGNDTVSSTEVWAATSIRDGQWHYVAVVFDGDLDGGTLSLYLDGTLDASEDSLAVSLADPDVWYIGGKPFATFVDGVMDEVRVSNIARSAAEISANY